MKINIAQMTHQGEVRDHNEDNFLVYRDLTQKERLPSDQDIGKEFEVGQDGTLLIVADGMGGMNAGEVASDIAVKKVEEYLLKNGRNIKAEKVKKILCDSIKFANHEIGEHAKKHPEHQGMGTTLIAVWLRDEKAHCAWVGDSRFYISRPGQELIPISKDHSLVQEYVDAGKMSYEDAFFHPRNHIVTQSLGDGGQSVNPSYLVLSPQTNDRVLVCSDGLNSMLEDKDIDAIVSKYDHSVQEVTSELVQAARDAGGHDNITVVVSDLKKVAASKPLAGEYQIKQPATAAAIAGQDFVEAEDRGPGRNTLAGMVRLAEDKTRLYKMLLILTGILLASLLALFYFTDMLGDKGFPFTDQKDPATVEDSTKNGVDNPIETPPQSTETRIGSSPNNPEQKKTIPTARSERETYPHSPATPKIQTPEYDQEPPVDQGSKLTPVLDEKDLFQAVEAQKRVAAKLEADKARRDSIIARRDSIRRDSILRAQQDAQDQIRRRVNNPKNKDGGSNL